MSNYNSLLSSFAIEGTDSNCDWLIKTIESKGAKTIEQTEVSISSSSVLFQCSFD